MVKNLNLSPAFLCLIVLLSSVYRDGISTMANELPVGGEQQVWCVAKPSTGEDKLQKNIAYVCNEVGMDCGLIQRDGPCSVPETNINYASVVMNLYFQKYGRFPHTCDFSNSGLIVLTDPSYEGCLYSFGAA